MAEAIPEADWKYARTIRQEMLDALFVRVNRQARAILDASDATEQERYRRLYKHLDASDKVIGDCFDDWRRSVFILILLCLRHHNLLTDEHLTHLTPETRKQLERCQVLRDQ